MDGECTNCGKLLASEGGLYDADDVLLCTWAESGIDVGVNYTSSTYKTTETSGYYVLTNNYPTAVKAVIPEGITSIGEKSFIGCKQLETIILPEGLTRIEDAAFSNLSIRSIGSLEGECDLRLPASVTFFGSSVFANCPLLKTVELPDGITYIGYAMFYGCSGLTYMDIPDSVTWIRGSSFYGCTSLKTLYIPKSVEKIEATNYTNGLFYDYNHNSYTDQAVLAKIYCGAASKPANWSSDWNCYGYGKLSSSSYASNGKLYNTTTFNVTREQYEALYRR